MSLKTWLPVLVIVVGACAGPIQQVPVPEQPNEVAATPSPSLSTRSNSPVPDDERAPGREEGWVRGRTQGCAHGQECHIEVVLFSNQQHVLVPVDLPYPKPGQTVLVEPDGDGWKLVWQEPLKLEEPAESSSPE